MAETDALFTRGADTFVDSTEPTLSHEGLPFARLVKSQSVYLIREGYGNIPTTAGSSGWRQNIRVADDFGGGSVTFKLYRLAAPWVPSVGYADAPAFTADAPVTLTGPVAVGDILAFDVSTFTALAVADPSTYYGYGLVVDTVGVSGRVCTLSAPEGMLGNAVDTVRPTLSGSWYLSPDAPTKLTPGGDRKVGTAWPVLQADFGETAIAAVQVQIKSSTTGFNPVTGIPSPTFDSGTYPTTDPSYPLLGSGYAGLPNSTPHPYWTMRVLDTDGHWSQYAQPVQTYYGAKLGLTVTKPAVGTIGDALVDYAWTVTGGTQARYQVVTAATAAPTAPIDDSTEVPSSVGGYTGVLLPDSRSITATVRVWPDDAETRQATPGCDIYTETQVQFAFADDLTVKKPAAIIATQIGGSPWNLLQTTMNNKLLDTEALLFVRDGDHIFRRTGAQMDAPVETEAGFVYSVIDYKAQPFTTHVYGVKQVHGGKTSKPTEYLFTAREVPGVSLVDETTGEYAWCSGMGSSFVVEDQVGVLTGLGQGYATVTSVANGGKSGTVTGTITDTYGRTATEWLQSLRSLAHGGAELQMAYLNVSYPVRIWNFLDEPLEESPDPFVRQVSFRFAQQGKESLTDGTTEQGQVINLYDFEEGTNNAAIAKESLGGSPGVIDKTGSPVYKTASARHGAMGAHLAPGDSLTYQLKNFDSSTQSVYLRFTGDTASGSTPDTFITIDDVEGHNIAKLRIKPSLKFTLEDAAGTTIAKSGNKTTVGTGDDDWLRVNPTVSWDGTQANVIFPIALEDESNTYSDTLGGTCAASAQPYSFTIQTGGHLDIDLDSVRTANNASAYLGPINPDLSLFTPQFVMAGGATSTSVIVATAYSSDDPGLMVDLAYSTASDMSSAVLVGQQAISADLITRHTISSLTPDTQYYGRLVNPATGAYVGEQFMFKPLPASGVTYSLKIAAVSCQANNDDAPHVWQDILDWVPDGIWHFGDWGYWGQGIAANDPYTKDLTKRVNSVQTNAIMRQALQAATINAVTISDHELHVNGDAWQKGDADDTLGCPHSIRELQAFQAFMPIRTYWDTRTPRQYRGYHFDIGAKVRVLMTDFRSPERNLADDPDSSSKQMWGADQEAKLFANLDPSRLNIIVNETSWLASPPPANLDRAHDKPWFYRTAQNRLKDKVNGTGPYTGGPAYKVVWVGGDRHYLGHLTGGSNTLGGWPCYISSGTYKNGLDLQDGETMTWQYGANQRTVQTVKPGGSGLTSFTLTYSGQTTSSIAASATASTVQAALEALSNIAPGDVVVSGNAGGPWTIAFGGALSNNMTELTATPTGGSGTVAIIQEDSPVCGYLQLTLSYNSSTGLVTLAMQARGVLDTSGPISSWVIANVPGGTASDSWTP